MSRAYSPAKDASDGANSVNTLATSISIPPAGNSQSALAPVLDQPGNTPTGPSQEIVPGISGIPGVPGTVHPESLTAPNHYLSQEQAYIYRMTPALDEHPLNDQTDFSDDLAYNSDEDDLDDSIDGSIEGGVIPATPSTLILPVHAPCDEATIKNRLEWQVMLTNVLTGEIFRAEKTRLKGNEAQNKSILPLWVELKAKCACRSLSEQQRILAAGRSMATDVLDRVVNFKKRKQNASLEETYAEIGELLSLVERMEALYPDGKAVRENLPVYASDEYKTRIDAITGWYTVYQSILQELDLLQRWTGNDEADPTLPMTQPNRSRNNSLTGDSIVSGVDDEVTLVKLVLKQDGALQSIFESHIERYIFPLIARARACTLLYSSEFIALNMPVLSSSLGPMMAFPVKLIQQAIELRLQAAVKMHSPVIVMIDEAVAKFEVYMSLGLKLTQNYIQLGEPVLDKGWMIAMYDGTSLNDTMLRSIRFYLELLSNKFLEGGSSSMSFFRSFKSIEQLEGHFNFLQGTCQLIEGGDISVAEQFTSLHLRVLSRLLAYWEHQMNGPAKLEKMDIDRWFADTCENIRGIHRKLIRFFRTLCNTYENCAEYQLPADTKIDDILERLRQNDFFLVIPESVEGFGCYAFASSNLKNRPHVVKNMLQGYCRPPASDSQEEPGSIVLVSVSEALNWFGDVHTMPVRPQQDFTGQIALVAQGGFHALQRIQQHHQTNLLDQLKPTSVRKSYLIKVETELHRMRAAWLRLSMSVLQSAMTLRARICQTQPECEETVQIMMSFARDFGERSLQLVSESQRNRIVLKLFSFCLDWIDFVVDDCPPSDNRTFKWTVTALEFAMKMTGGVNILALPEVQFSRLRRKVAGCVMILISHFDIMGARSKVANMTNHQNRIRQAQMRGGISGSPANTATNVLIDDDAVIAAQRTTALEKFDQLSARNVSQATRGKILDHNNTEFEFLSFASSPFTAAAMRWQRAEPIGSGAFGSVFKANSLDDFQVMAVKEVRISSTQSISKVLKSIKDEMTVLEMVSHPNIVQYYGVEVHRERVYIFMEYCPGGSLAEMLQYDRIEDESIVQFFTLQMFEGLAYLHDSGIVHRDIKPENILLKNNFIKIVDFGAAKIIAKKGNMTMQTQLEATKGTPMYMAPEVIKGKRSANRPSIDVWSMGCVLLQIVTGQLPWSECDNVYSILYYIGTNRIPTIPNNDTISPACRSLLVRCLQYQPESRPTSIELLRDPWFDEARETLNQFLEMRNEDFEINERERMDAQREYSSLEHQIPGDPQVQHQQEQQEMQELQEQQEQPRGVYLEERDQLSSEGPEDDVLINFKAPEQVSLPYADRHYHSSSEAVPMEPIVESDMEYEKMEDESN